MVKYYNEHPEKWAAATADRNEKRRLCRLRVCLMCGISFEAKRGDAKYCSTECCKTKYYKEHPEKWQRTAEQNEHRNALRRLQRAQFAGE
jgi:hypothetical protein